MCFGMHCEHEAKSGPDAGECTLPPGQYKCPELQPGFEEAMEAYYPTDPNPTPPQVDDDLDDIPF